MTRRMPRGDDGASLVLVLVLVTVVAVGLAATLSFADTSIRTTINMRAQAAATYATDGAMQAAINAIRTDSGALADKADCFPDGSTLNLAGFYGAEGAPAHVTCDEVTSGVPIQCGTPGCNRPGNAILTLASGSEEGINIQQPVGSTFKVHGRVFSNSTINVDKGSLTTNTRVYARGTCTGTIESTPQQECNYGTTPNALGNDPGYLPEISTAPGHRALPACTTPNSVVTFQPGYYDDAAGLSAMMAGNSACRHSTWWFKPGTYYFDFHNAGTAGSVANPLLPSAGGNVWTVDDGYLVAGTPVGSPVGGLTPPPVPATIPGSCMNPVKSVNAVGVQFIFGGDSRLAVKSGHVEICGSYSGTKPPVAVYGLTTGSATTTALTGNGSLKLTAVPSPGEFAPGATVTNLAEVDGTPSAKWKSDSANDSATMTVTGFAPPAVPPAGSILTAAAVRVTHRHSDVDRTDSFDLAVTPTGQGSPATGSGAGRPGGGTFHTDSIPVDTAGTGSLARAVYAGTFTGASIAVTAKMKAKNHTEEIDAIKLEVSYVPPALRAASGCVTAPYPGTGDSACAVVSSLNTSGNRFYVQGTTYTPNGVVDVTLNNAAEQVFRFGVVVRSLWVKLTGSFAFEGAVIEVPDDSPGGSYVYLSAHPCGKDDPCPVALRAKVAFLEPDPLTDERAVSVLSWSRPT